MESLGLRAFQVQLAIRGSEDPQEKQVLRETEAFKVPEEFLDPRVQKETRACQVSMVATESPECPEQRVKQGSLDLPVTWDYRVYQVYLGFLVQKVWLAKRVTRVLRGSLVSWEVQENQANKDHQERLDLGDLGAFQAAEARWDQKALQAYQGNWDLLAALAFLACLGPLDFLE